MRDFVKVSLTLWRSKKFTSLPSDDARLCYLYLLTCPHSNSAGCFDIPTAYAGTDLSWEKERFEYSLRAVIENGLADYDWAERTILLSGWFAFNAPANAKHALGILNQLAQASSLVMKVKCYKELRSVIVAKRFDREAMIKNALSLFDEQFGYGIPTKTETKMETERETRPRGDLDLDARESSEPPRFAVAALTGNGSAAIGNKVLEMPPLPDQLNRLLQTNLMRKTG